MHISYFLYLRIALTVLGGAILAEIIPFSPDRGSAREGKADLDFYSPLQYKIIKMKKLFLLSGAIFIYLLSYSQTKESLIKLDSVVVSYTRAGDKTPVAVSMLKKEQIRRSSPVESVPMLLSMMPSVVSSTEGGNGMGYSSLRVRGSDGSRINVTLNGIALNDAESQQVFWVNIPSLTTYLEDVQLQRGVGTSSNGSGAFGASINMKTLSPSLEPYGKADFSYGSYNTFLASFGAGSGILKNGLSFDAFYSKGLSDGYINNGFTDLNSLFLSLGWYNRNNSFKINYVMGDQKSGITWEGISKEQMKINRRYNPAGKYKDPSGNTLFYHNETDNYTQHHFQFNHIVYITDNTTLNSTLHYTKGDGYYENYKSNRKFSSYRLDPQVVKDVKYTRSDLIQRQGLDNDYWAFNTLLNYNISIANVSLGLSAYNYSGDHQGRVIWSMYNESIPSNYEWYLNHGDKNEVSSFIRVETTFIKNLLLYADLQYRFINYKLTGEDKDFALLDWKNNYNFVNPKFGISYNINRNRFFASYSRANKEPSRSDIKESIKAGTAQEILSEKLNDYEFGYKYLSEKLAIDANLFFMEYKDQLVPTGRLTETGYLIKENVDKSYRRGVEFMIGWRPYSKLFIQSSLSLSQNKIKNYTHYVDIIDEYWSVLGQQRYNYNKTDIVLSPSIISAMQLSYDFTPSTTLRVIGKYVGKSYLDNTSDKSVEVPEYFTMATSLSKSFIINNKNLDLSLFLDNIFNKHYFSNGWVYRAQKEDGTKVVSEGVYPQALRNLTIKASFNF